MHKKDIEYQIRDYHKS